MDYKDIACNIIKTFEGFVPYAYKCPAGVWTIGYGTTAYPDGSFVKPGDAIISAERALKLLKLKITSEIDPILAKRIPTWASMNGNQKAAIVSFAYNLGTYFYGNKGFDTITRALSSQNNWKNVPAALMLYVNPGSQFENGLRHRRKEEGELWESRGRFAILL